jgi:GPH family glycoside/pentoside/hexuronide:cation symporter
VFKDIDNDSLTFSATVVNEAKGFQSGVTLYAILAVILFLMTFGFTRERVQPPASQKTSLRDDLRDLWHNRPWFILFFLGIFTLTFVCIRNGSIMYYFKYYVGNEGLASAFMVVGTIANIAGVMLTGWFGRKLGKRNTYMGGMAIASVMIIAFYFLKPQDIALMFILQVLLSFVLGPTSPLVWAMYADAADYSEWRTGRRATGLVFSAASFAIKFGWTIGGALAGWLLAYFGFRANVEQTPNTLTGICLMMSFIPAFASALAAVFVMFYKLDEPTMEKIAEELAARRAAAGESGAV